MNTEIFSEARRVFEILPGVGTLEQGIAKLTRAGVEHSRVRAWALSVADEYGILSYVHSDIERLMRGVAKLAQTEE